MRHKHPYGFMSRPAWLHPSTQMASDRKKSKKDFISMCVQSLFALSFSSKFNFIFDAAIDNSLQFDFLHRISNADRCASMLTHCASIQTIDSMHYTRCSKQITAQIEHFITELVKSLIWAKVSDWIHIAFSSRSFADLHRNFTENQCASMSRHCVSIQTINSMHCARSSKQLTATNSVNRLIATRLGSLPSKHKDICLRKR